jgi:hypothetical protein
VELKHSAGGRLLSDVPREFGKYASWEDFSIATIKEHVRGGGKLHFDLTNMKDIPGTLDGTGKHAGTVTGAEIRFIKSQWSDPRFRANVHFYENGVEREPPW